MLDKLRKQLAENMEKIENEINDLIDKNNHEDFNNLQTIPGIGKKSAAALIATTDAMQRFDNHRQVCSYFGLSPRTFQSGTSVKGKARICKMGMSRIRRLLYLAAVSASRYNPPCRELYQRLVMAGKAKKLALVAVANKLIKIAFAICKNKTIFQPNYACKY